MTTASETAVTEEPYERTTGPIHTYFGLSYANFLVIHRAQLQSMPSDWQRRFVDLLEDLNAAYDHLDRPDFEVKTVRDAYVGDLTPDELRAAGATPGDVDEDEDEFGTWYSADGRELDSGSHVGVPVPDPIPHYKRAYLPPDEDAIEAARLARQA